MTKQEVINMIVEEAQSNNWVAITDKGRIWGSDASYNNIQSGGGKLFILNSAEIKGENTQLAVRGRYHTLEEIAEEVLEYI